MARRKGLCPGLVPPGFEAARRAFLSFDGGKDDVLEVLRGKPRWAWS